MGYDQVAVNGKTLIRNLPLPPGQVVGMAATVLLDRWRAVPVPLPRGARRAGGSALIAAGCLLTGWALSERRRHEDSTFDLERPQALVTSGPYALSRHPMYTGWWLIHLGFGTLRGSAWVLLTLPVAILIEHRAVITEEKWLVQAFGRQFLWYAARVPRYLPRSIARPRHRRV